MDSFRINMINIVQIEEQLGINYKAAVIEKLSHPLFDEKKLSVYIKREDLLHSVISGNKWRKLKYNLLQALQTGHSHLISMGGPYSNHLHALAYVGYQLGIQTTGLIRGERPQHESATLSDLRQWGMQLKFVSRDEFSKLRQYREPEPGPSIGMNGFWITEGAANSLALPGVKEILSDVELEYDTLTVSCGTGTTLAGLAGALPPDKSVLGFATLKGGEFLETDINRLLTSSQKNWFIDHNYHFGGFAKKNNQLIDFIDEFQMYCNIPVDSVYNGKMLFGLFQLIGTDFFQKEHKIIALHTGGLQGMRS